MNPLGIGIVICMGALFLFIAALMALCYPLLWVYAWGVRRIAMRESETEGSK